MIEKLDKRRPVQEEPEKEWEDLTLQQSSPNSQFSLNNWVCLGTLQAANSPVMSIAAH